MPATQAQIGFGAQLGRRGTNLTTIALAITASGSPQAVTPASMTSIVVGSVLAIDTANAVGIGANEQEFVLVTAVTGSTFTAIFQNNHGTSINIALMVPVLEIYKIGGPTMKADMKEATNMASPSGYKEYISGLRDGGTITFEGNYIPKESTNSQATLRTDFESGTQSAWTVTLPTAGEGIWYATAGVQDLSPAIPLDDRITCTGTLKITGKPVLF